VRFGRINVGEMGEQMLKVYAIAAAAAAAGLVGASYWATRTTVSSDPMADCRDSRIAGGAGSIGGPFTLVNGDGETVTEADVLTKPSLVYFGYTYCPDVCPADAARNAEATDMLLEKGYDVQPVFISVDPDRDTPEVLGEWTGYMHERMIGLTGSRDQIDVAVKAYRSYYKIQPGDPEFYLVDHLTHTYLVLPEEGFVEFFRHEAPAEDVAEKTACFLDASG